MEQDSGASEEIASANEKITIIRTKLCDLEHSIQKGEIDCIKDITIFLHEYFTCNKDTLVELYQSGHKCQTQTDLIFSACFHKQADILYYLLHETDILDYLTDTNDDVHKIDMQRVAAIRYAIYSEDFNMVEMLYDYWCGELHWSVNDDTIVDLNDIKRLGYLLKNAQNACMDYLIQKQQMLVNVHSLIKFNEFQQNLYSKLHELKAKTNVSNDKQKQAKAVGTMLLSVLQVYNKYSYIEVVRLPNSECAQEESLQLSLKDRSTLYFRGLSYIMYEVYFRKLDFNVCLLILEYWNVLRNHLKYRFNAVKKKDKFPTQNTNPVPSIESANSSHVHAALLFDEIECTLYHFIYRTSEDWRLYLQTDRKKTVEKNRVGLHKGQIITNIELKYDKTKLYNGAVIYFERRFFKKRLKKLKNIIKKHVISREVPTKMLIQKDQKKSKVSTNKKVLLDDNYLKGIKYMRDYYSLKKILYYINAVKNSKDLNVLMIERILQVIGEMLKSTEDSYHLTPHTKALLQAEISVETIKHLHNVREYLSHAGKGQLSRRIEVANEQKDTFAKIQQDLKSVRVSIETIHDIYQSVLDRHLLEHGLSLLENRMNQIPVKLKRYYANYYLYLRRNADLENEFVQKGFTVQILKEIDWIKHNMDELHSKRELAYSCIVDLTATILPKYIEYIKVTLNDIEKNNEEVGLIKSDLSQHNIKQLPDYPKLTNITDISRKLEKVIKRNKKNDLSSLLERLKNIKDLSDHWESIKYVLYFFLQEIDCEIFNVNAIYYYPKIMEQKNPDSEVVECVNKLLEIMKIWCSMQSCNVCPNSVTKSTVGNVSLTQYTFDGIKDLDINLYTKNSNTQNSLKFERDQLISCLINRMDLLSKLMYSTEHVRLPLRQQLIRYKRDQQFQFQIEMLLVDIANILVQCKIRLMTKSAKLLTGIDLGNVLDHGNPFLEVIGDILNSKDFSTALLTKALMFVDDREAIAALYVLFKSNIGFNAIKWDNRHLMNDDQKKCLDQFKMCDRWELYLKLIPWEL